MKYLGLLNSQLSLIIPALIQLFGIFLLREHLKISPDELSDFFWPNVYITNPSRMVAPLGLVTFPGDEESGSAGWRELCRPLPCEVEVSKRHRPT